MLFHLLVKSRTIIKLNSNRQIIQHTSPFRRKCSSFTQPRRILFCYDNQFARRTHLSEYSFQFTKISLIKSMMIRKEHRDHFASNNASPPGQKARETQSRQSPIHLHLPEFLPAVTTEPLPGTQGTNFIIHDTCKKQLLPRLQIHIVLNHPEVNRLHPHFALCHDDHIRPFHTPYGFSQQTDGQQTVFIKKADARPSIQWKMKGTHSDAGKHHPTR